MVDQVQTIRIVVDPSAAIAANRTVRRSLNRTTTAADRLRRTLRNAFLIFGGAFVLRQALTNLRQLADSYINVSNRIRLVTQSEAELIATRGRLLQTAQETRAAFDATSIVYGRLALASDNLGRTQEELINIARLLNQQVLIGGSTAAEARAGLIQFSQGIASNRLQGDELRSVLENLLGVQQGLIEGFRQLYEQGEITFEVTRGNLRDLAAEGTLTAELLLRAVEESEEGTERRFAQINRTIEQGFTLVTNSLVNLVGTLGDALGVVRFISDELGNIAFQIDLISQSFTIDTSDIALLERLGQPVQDDSLLGRLQQIARGTLDLIIPGTTGGVPTAISNFLLPPTEFERAEQAYRRYLRTIETAEISPDAIRAQLQIAQNAIEIFGTDSNIGQRAEQVIERLTGLSGENVDRVFRELRSQLAEQLERLAQVTDESVPFAERQRELGGRSPFREARRIQAQIDEIREQLDPLTVLRDQQFDELQISVDRDFISPRERTFTPEDELEDLRRSLVPELERIALEHRDRLRALAAADITPDERFRLGELSRFQRDEERQEFYERERADINALREDLQTDLERINQAARDAFELIGGTDFQDPFEASILENRVRIRRLQEIGEIYAENRREAEREAREREQSERAAQARALEHARALRRLQNRLVEVGLAERDVAREAEIWATEMRDAIDQTAAGADRALADVERIVDRFRQLQSDNPLIGLRIGLESYRTSFGSVAEGIRDVVVGSFRQMENALVSFVRTGQLNFRELVLSIISELARIQLQQHLLGPLSTFFSGLFGAGATATPGQTFGPAGPPGAFLPTLAGGGLILGPGTGTSDSIPARLSSGEFVVNAAATRQYLPLLERINSFQQGGFVSREPRIVINNFNRGVQGRDINVERRRNSSGELEEISISLRESTDGAIRQGQFDQAMASRYGITPRIR